MVQRGRDMAGVTEPAMILLAVLSVVSGVSVKISPSDAECYYFDLTQGDCGNPMDPACQNQTRRCPSTDNNQMVACSAVWRNSSDRGFVVQNQGCWNNDGDCVRGMPCVSTRFLGEDTYFCCCFGDLCNGELVVYRLEPTGPSPSTTKPISGRMPVDGSQDYLIRVILYSLVPISVFTVLTIAMYWMCRRYRYSINLMVPLENGEPSPLMTPLTPSTNNSFQPVQLMEIKARGRFGAVWKAQMDNKYVAVKVFPLQDRQSWICEQEIYNLPNMKHENVLQFLGTEKRGDGLDTTFWLVTEYHPLGSLYDYLKANLVTWNGLCHIIDTMTQGLSFIHEPSGAKPPIAHRDFKSKNVLLKNDTTACIADFGLAIKFDPGKKLSDNHGQVGTRRYMAPEVLEGTIQFNQDAFMRLDMYACGLVMWELVTRCSAQDGPVDEYMLPFEEEIGQAPSLEGMIEVVVENRQRPVFQDTWLKHPGLSSICETIEECWDHEAEARLTAGCVEARISHLLRTNQQVIATNNANHINNGTSPLITELSSDSIHKESSF